MVMMGYNTNRVYLSSLQGKFVLQHGRNTTEQTTPFRKNERKRHNNKKTSMC